MSKKELEPEDLNDYGKQLYWIASGMRAMCGELMRCYDGSNDKKEDEIVNMIVNHIRSSAEGCEELLDKLKREKS